MAGGTNTAAKLEPLVEIDSARPRRCRNHRTTVALHGTNAALIPIDATRPRASTSCSAVWAMAVST